MNSVAKYELHSVMRCKTKILFSSFFWAGSFEIVFLKQFLKSSVFELVVLCFQFKPEIHDRILLFLSEPMEEIICEFQVKF